MKITELEIEKLIPYERNNRIHSDDQIANIATSIEKFGFNQPIIIDETNTILVGHGRLDAAKKLGLKKVPIVQLNNLSEQDKIAYRILDNKLQNDSSWDFGNLAIEFGKLEDVDFDFNFGDLQSLMNLIQPVEGRELDESIADGVKLETKFTLNVSIDDENLFEKDLKELLVNYPTIKMSKSS